MAPGTDSQDALAREEYCYLTTTGRVTGKPHTVEIWFGMSRNTLYVLAGGREGADFVRNAGKQTNVSVRIGKRTLAGRARIVDPDSDEDALARRLLLEKYTRSSSGDLTAWGRDALPLAVDFDR